MLYANTLVCLVFDDYWANIKSFSKYIEALCYQSMLFYSFIQRIFQLI